MNEDLKYLDYEGLQDFKQRLDLQIQNEKDLILTEITNIGNSKADIDDISPEVIIEDANGYEYVEIAGIKWATCNVGANKDTFFCCSYYIIICKSNAHNVASQET